jgi:hypothetical protein
MRCSAVGKNELLKPAVHGLNCGCIVHRHERAVAAAKAQGTTPKLALPVEPEPKVEPAVVVKVRKAAVPSVKSVGNGPGSDAGPQGQGREGGEVMDQDKLVEMTKVRLSTMLSIVDALGGVVSQDDVRKVAMVKLSPTAIRAASLLANVMLVDLECLTLAMAGLSDDAALEALLAGLQVPQMSPRPRRRRWPQVRTARG